MGSAYVTVWAQAALPHKWTDTIFGVHQRFSVVSGDVQGVQGALWCCMQVFAKVQHNKQLLKATWQRRQGVRVFFNRAF